MSKDLCLDCGMLLSPRSRICSVCGFDNDAWDNPETALRTNDPDSFMDFGEEAAPENYPGF